MFDICNIFKNLQKVFQKSNLILFDVISARDAAIVNLSVLKEMPLLGGKEEKYREELEHCRLKLMKVVEGARGRMQLRNKYATTASKQESAVRLEVVQSAINFLTKG